MVLLLYYAGSFSMNEYLNLVKNPFDEAAFPDQ